MVLPKSAVSKLCEKMSSRLRKTAVKGEQEEYDEKQDCPVPYIACVCKGVPVPKSPDGPLAGVRMRCKNDRCHLATILLHKKCFEQLEETLLKILSNLGSARGWTDAQLRSNLWEKKGQTLIAKLLRCHCGQGLMSLDVDFYKKRELEEQQQQAASVAEARLRKKGAKRSKLPALNFSNNTPVSAELLQNDFVSVGRRFCHGQTSHSASALIYGNDQSDSDAEIPFERKSATPPVQSILFVEKPKPLSIGHLKPKSDLEAVPPRPLALFRQRKATVKSHKSSIGNNHKLSSAESQSQQHAKSMQIRISCSNGKASEQQQLMSRVELGSKVETKQPQQPKKLPVMRDNRHPIDRGAMSAGPNQHPSTALTQKTTQHMGEEPENYYSLFDNRSHGFYLGEILLGETFLPGLVLPRMFPHSL